MVIKIAFDQENTDLGMLARQGENLSTTLQIDCSTLLLEYPSAVIAVRYVGRMPGEKYYDLPVTDKGSGMYEVELRTYDTAWDGNKEIVIRAIDGEWERKSRTFYGYVARSPFDFRPPAGAVSDWLYQLQEALQKADAADEHGPVIRDGMWHVWNDGAYVNTGVKAEGVDGFSPTVTVESIEGGHRVTITDANGKKSFDVMDGKEKDVSDMIATSAAINGQGVAEFMNAAGVVLYTLDLSGLAVEAYGDIVLSLNALALTEGGTGTFAVNLSAPPTKDQVVYLAVNDETRLTVTPAAITFTAANYNIPQDVTVTAAQDEDYDDNEGVITLTSQRYSKQIVVTVTDDDELYLPFGGKEIIFNASGDTIGEDSELGVATWYDAANDETTYGYDKTLLGVLRNIASNDAISGGSNTKAYDRMLANETGAYSFVWEATLHASGEHGDMYNGSYLTMDHYMMQVQNYYGSNGWQTLAAYIAASFYVDTSGAVQSITLAKQDSTVKLDEIASKAKNWSKNYMAVVYKANGEVEFYACDSLIYTMPAPADFAKWRWNYNDVGHGNDLFEAKENYVGDTPRFDRFMIVNDAITAEDIADYYEHSVAENF